MTNTKTRTSVTVSLVWAIPLASIIIIPLLGWGIGNTQKTESAYEKATKNEITIKEYKLDSDTAVEQLQADQHDNHIEQMQKLHKLEILIIEATK